MDTKWKIILMIMMIIISICGVFITIFISDSQNNLKNLVAAEITSVKSIVKAIEEANSRYYSNRIKAFVNYIEVPKHEKIISTFALEKRDELLRQTTPYLKFFKKENPYFSTFAWITQNNHVFLRVHLPKVFGDKIDQIRPDIVKANKEQQANDGYMVARRGVQYRLVQPVFFKDEHVGVVQFGLETNQFIDNIRNKLKRPVGIAISNKKFSAVTLPKYPFLAGDTHTIQSKELDLFQQNNDGIDWSLAQQQVTLHGKPYIIANAFKLLNYRQEIEGYIFVALDISEHKKKLQSRIIFIIFLSSALILISFSILYFSYGSLILKITALNKALKRSNESLEYQVDQRTTILQQEIVERKKSEKERKQLIKELREALENIKTLSGLLPICSHCKKIRDDKGYWNQIEGYIQEHSEAKFSHSMCPECLDELYGNDDWYIEMKKEKGQEE